jgi:hypothetical protein
MWFSPCAAIHTIGMRTPIAVLFLDDRGTVLQIHPHVPPHKPAVMCPGAHVTVELGTAALATSDILIGDRLELSEA